MSAKAGIISSGARGTAVAKQIAQKEIDVIGVQTCAATKNVTAIAYRRSYIIF